MPIIAEGRGAAERIEGLFEGSRAGRIGAARIKKRLTGRKT